MNITNTNVTILVKDMQLSIQFYQSIGFTVKQQWGNHFAMLIAAGIEIGLHPSERNTINVQSSAISIGFTTSNFSENKAELEKLGIKVKTRNEEGGNFLHFNDPDGTPLYIIESKW